MSHTDPTIPSGQPPDPRKPLGSGWLPSDAAPTSGISPRDPATPSDQPDEGPGSIIGPYRILQALGEGGFGIVYLAEQREPVERRVALKIIKLGLETKEVLARFEAERQALALMDHPAIAKVLDAGTTSTGRPYFVMEFVAGVPVHEYCDQHRLTTSDRLRLFVDICGAVHHAHQKGIIHRDLKPSNILVTHIDGKPLPKVIDFGIAKATTRRLTDKTIFTETGRLLGTPEYMSPEQAGTTGLDVDTRTDVYSLGVVLYQLLVGALPFDSRTLRSAGYEGIMRIIREEDPPRMSTKLSRTPQTVSATAEKRRSDAKTLANELRGDLDWITARAMEKDRTRRYASASELAADVERFLANEPIVARPPSSAYKIAKFARRNRAMVIAGGALAAAIVLGLAGTTWGMMRARASERVAVTARTEAEAARELAEKATEAEAAQRKRAESEAAKAVAINGFMQSTIAAVSPAKTTKPNITVREVLDEARRASMGPGSFANQPEVEIALRQTMGRTYRAIGAYADAETLLTGTLNARIPLGAEHPELAESYDDLGILNRLQRKTDEAIRLLRSALDIRRKHFGAEHELVADTMSNLAVALNDKASGPERAEARRLLETALPIHKKARGETHPATLTSMRNLAAVLAAQGELSEAIRISRQLLAVQEALPNPETRDLARTLSNLGEFFRRDGKYDEAETALKRSAAIRKSVLSPGHFEIGEALGNLGLVQQTKGDFAAAETTFREALALARAGVDGKPRADVDYDLQNLANLLLDQAWTAGPGDAASAKLTEAVTLAREALDIRTKRDGPTSPDLGYTRLALGRALLDQGKLAEAEPLLRAAAEQIAKSAPNGAAVWHARTALGGLLVAQAKHAEAEPILLEAYDKIVAIDKNTHIRARQTAERLAALYRAKGDAAKADEWAAKIKP